MRKMFEVEFIRKKHFNEGWSIRKIGKQLGMSRVTVRKALRSAQIPRYTLSSPRPAPVMDSVAQVVLTWLEQDTAAPPKQRHTAKRIYDRLVEEYGFSGGESTVRRFVAKHKKQAKEVFIPLTCDFGELAQVDWGQAHVRVAGAPTVAHLFCVRLRKSAAPFAMAFPTEKIEAFLAGHVGAFAWFGGVPAALMYDNPKTAVTRILAGPERDLHELFSSLRAHYLFDSIFCAPGEANEKGSVENLVGYVRRNALVPVRDFASYDHLNQHLAAWCEKEKMRHKEEFELDRAHLKNLPPSPFKAAVGRFVGANRLSLINFDRNRYSVPCRFVGQSLWLEAFWDRLDLFFDNALVCSHPRCHGRGRTITEILHYLPALETKQRAVCHASVVRELPAAFGAARRRLVPATPDGYKDFAAILLLIKEFGLKRVGDALGEAPQMPVLSAEVVRRIITNKTCEAAHQASVPPHLAAFKVTFPDLCIYDTLAVR